MLPQAATEEGLRIVSTSALLSSAPTTNITMMIGGRSPSLNTSNNNATAEGGLMLFGTNHAGAALLLLHLPQFQLSNTMGMTPD